MSLIRKKCISCHTKGKKTKKGWSGAYILDGTIAGKNKYVCMKCGRGYVDEFHNKDKN